MAIGATGTGPGFDELLSLTVQKIEGELVDQVLQQHPTLDLFREVIGAGEGPNHIEPVRGALLGRTAASDALGTFSTAVDGDIAGVVKYEYSNPIVTPTSVAFRAIALNQGSNRVVEMVKAHLEAAKDDHAVALAGALYNAGAVAGEFNDIDTIIDDTAVLGGIDPASAAWWKSTVQAPAAGTDIRLSLRNLSNAVLDASGKKADVILMGADAFDAYEASLDDQIRYNALAVGDSRFSELRFAGMTIRRDGIDAPADKVYFINKSSLVAKNLQGYFMKPEAAQTIQGTLTQVVPMATMVLFGTRERRAHGKFTYVA